MHDRSLPHGKMLMLHPGECVPLTANPTSWAVDVKHVTKGEINHRHLKIFKGDYDRTHTNEFEKPPESDKFLEM